MKSVLGVVQSAAKTASGPEAPPPLGAELGATALDATSGVVSGGTVFVVDEPFFFAPPTAAVPSRATKKPSPSPPLTACSGLWTWKSVEVVWPETAIVFV